jgi:hypothetical protein
VYALETQQEKSQGMSRAYTTILHNGIMQGSFSICLKLEAVLHHFFSFTIMPFLQSYHALSFAF